MFVIYRWFFLAGPLPEGHLLTHALKLLLKRLLARTANRVIGVLWALVALAPELSTVISLFQLFRCRRNVVDLI